MGCVCHRCGKVLCTEQSLSYHLKKKKRCDQYKCNICGKLHTNKSQLDICTDKCLYVIKNVTL